MGAGKMWKLEERGQLGAAVGDPTGVTGDHALNGKKLKTARARKENDFFFFFPQRKTSTKKIAKN